MLGSAVILAGHAAAQVNPAVIIARSAVPALARELAVECVASVVEHDVITVVEWAGSPGAPSPAGHASSGGPDSG